MGLPSVRDATYVDGPLQPVTGRERRFATALEACRSV
jgi:hypothetical protein